MLAATRSVSRILAPAVARQCVLRTSFPAMRRFASSGLSKEDVSARVLSVVKNFQNVDAAKVTPAAHFIKDLGLDSLDTVEIVLAIEDEFAIEIPDAEAEKIFTVAAAVDYISHHPQAK